MKYDTSYRHANIMARSVCMYIIISNVGLKNSLKACVTDANLGCDPGKSAGWREKF